MAKLHTLILFALGLGAIILWNNLFVFSPTISCGELEGQKLSKSSEEGRKDQFKNCFLT